MPRKDSSWIEQSGLYGTWTFTTQTMTDAGYYKGIAYVVMHLMPDPMQVQSCVIEAGGAGAAAKNRSSCLEADNKACSHTDAKDNEHEACINTETTDLEWSDVTAFFQFGFQFRTGIVRKTYHNVHTSDWLGPYNMILAPIHQTHKYTKAKDREDLHVSRYVNTPWTEAQLQRPFASSAIFNFDANILEDVVGTTAINQTIHVQKGWRGTPNKKKTVSNDEQEVAREWVASLEGLRDDDLRDGNNDDPYAIYSRTCAHGDLQPILPRLEVVRTTHPSNATTGKDGKHPRTTYSMKLDYSMLSLPERGMDDLYKLLPTMKKHLGGRFPLRGPYCYGNDPNRAYAIHLSYNSTAKPAASPWHGVRGCVAPWPCWKDDPKPPVLPPSSMIPEDNHSAGSYVLDPKGVEMLIVYGTGIVLFFSLIVNCQMANKILKLRRSSSGTGVDASNQQQQRPVPPSSAFRTPVQTRGGGGNNHDASVTSTPNDYLQEAAAGGDRSNPLEEPLLTASSDDRDHESRPLPSGVEESKQESE